MKSVIDPAHSSKRQAILCKFDSDFVSRKKLELEYFITLEKFPKVGGGGGNMSHASAYKND